jgi:PAS domain S-box-containing protein
VLAFCLSAIFEVYEHFAAWTRPVEAWEVDEVPSLLFALSLACVWYATRRVRDLRAEVAMRQQAEQAAHASEARYRALVEGSLQGLWIHKDFVIQFANQPLAVLFGYDSPAALAGQEIWQLVAPHEKVRLQDASVACLRGVPDPVRLEWQGRCKDGTWRWLESLLSPLSWEGTPAILVTVLDITARKRQDQVQQQLAYELHDGLAQLLLSAQYRLETFETLWQHRASRAEHHLISGIDTLHQAIAETRRLMARLRPVLLETLGLLPAVQQYVEELGHEAGWEVEYCAEVDDLRLPPEVETALFRMVQEALTNARKHAETPKISIVLQREGVHGDTCVAIIRDWGRGFDPARILASAQHFGLLGMRERARLLGGTCNIASQPGQGTTVTVRLPLPPQESV